MSRRPVLHTPASALFLLAVIALGVAATFALALTVGSVHVSPARALQALFSSASESDVAIVRDLRAPRALAAFVTGALLALAGAFMQVLLRNPLADPYVLGLSGGAAVAALASIALGHAALASPAAFVGALASTMLVFGLARTGDGMVPWTATRLLLTGIVIAAGWGAMIALLLSIAPDVEVRGMLFWLIGDLSAAPSGVPALLVLAVVLAVSLPFARDLNVLARGEAVAASLGVPVTRVTLGLHALAALATAAAVTTAGSVGFVGLVVPHALRLVIGNDQRVLLPSCGLVGGGLVVLADTAARTIAAPMQLPVGVVTALIGVPVFLWLLRRQ